LGIHWDSNSQSESPLGNVWVHALTPSYTPRNMKCDSQASLIARNLQALTFGREPKAKVAITMAIAVTFFYSKAIENGERNSRYLLLLCNTKKKAMTTSYHCLLHYNTIREEGDGNKLPSPFMLEHHHRRKQQQCCCLLFLLKHR